MAFADTFKALSDPARRETLMLLRAGKMSAGDIAAHFDMTGATVSYHLSQLEKADLIFKTKYKNYIYYELNTSVFEEIMMWFSQFLPPEESAENAAENKISESLFKEGEAYE